MTVASPRDALAVNAAALTAVMVRAVDTAVEFAEMLGDRRLNSIVIGPGAGVSARTRDFVHTALSAKRGLVLDADALTSFAEAPERLFEAIKAAEDAHVVLTPHEGEFPRLFSDISNKHPGRSKLERVRDAAERCGAVVLLKGPDTVVASPGWTRQHRVQRAALARHRRRRRRAGGNDRRDAGARRAGVRGRLHRRLDARRSRARGGTGADRGRLAGSAARGVPAAL